MRASQPWFLLALVGALTACGTEVVAPRAASSGAGAAGSSAGDTSGTGGGGAGDLVCAPGTADCDGDPGNACETTLDTDVVHCGACDVVCGSAHAVPTCSGGACTLVCEPGFGDCDANDATGCEEPLTSIVSCGACGVPCATTCETGACVACDDDGLALDSADPGDAVRAIGLCAGVVSAEWTLAGGEPPPVDPTKLANFHLGHGILPDFGPNNHPQQGTRLLALSSGTARRPTDPGFVHRNFDKGYGSTAPPGFPKENPACPGVVPGAPYDATGLEIEFMVPPGITGFSYDFRFFTHEWPLYLCSNFNDYFVANVTPFPRDLPDGNIAFDQQGNMIGVNTVLLDACGCPNGPPCMAPPSAPIKAFACTLGDDALLGTDFEAEDFDSAWTNASTGWLRTTAPVEPNVKFAIRFVIFDSTDHQVDSTALLDNWQWLASPGVVVQTSPIPNPL